MLKLKDFIPIRIVSDQLKSIGGGASTSWEPDQNAGTMVMYDSIDDAGCTLIFATGDNSGCDQEEVCE